MYSLLFHLGRYNPPLGRLNIALQNLFADLQTLHISQDDENTTALKDSSLDPRTRKMVSGKSI